MFLSLAVVFVASVAASTLVTLWFTKPIWEAMRNAAGWMKIQEDINRKFEGDSDWAVAETDRLWRKINRGGDG